MARPVGTRISGTHRTDALIGLAGAVLSGIGDVLILGRSSSGKQFDRAAGMIPPHIDPDIRWRSLWNGVAHSPRRVQVGTAVGLVGIGMLQWRGLRGSARAMSPGMPRSLAAASGAAFAVSGMLTHLYCGTVILDYRRAAQLAVESPEGPQSSPRSDTSLLAMSAVGALGALALFSGSLTVEALRRGRTPSPTRFATPFPCVMSTLLTFGLLPAPVAGYLRPASMSIGLMVYFAITAASSKR